MTQCPQPTKIAYGSAEEAYNALMSCWRSMRGRQLPIRYYHCQCGKWHLTHKPKRLYQRETVNT